MTKTSAREAQEGKKKYELMVIVNPDIGDVAAKDRFNEIKKMLLAAEAEIFFEDVWGMRDFMYPIKKHRRGWYAVLDFVIDPQKLKEIDGTLRIENEVLRHMLVCLPFSYEPKSYAVLEETKVELKTTPVRVERKPMVESRPPRKESEPKVTEKEEAPVVKAKEEDVKHTSLEDVDAKLRSIIDNPDINF